MGRSGGAGLFGWYSRDDRKKALSALEEVGVQEFAARPFARLSGGQRQRVLIARALSSDPDLLLLDEPTANVDMLGEEKFQQIIRDLSKRLTVLMVSHDLGFVSKFVKSVICVNRQCVMHPTSDITGKVISDIYGGTIRMVRHDKRYSAEEE
jgi:zinc transport system ATP-binding protein